MFGLARSHSFAMLIAVVLVSSAARTVDARSSSPVLIVQGGDGAVFLVQDDNAWTILPTAISDADLAALTPRGVLDGAIPAPFLGTDSVLQIVQAADRSLYVAQGGNLWLLVPAPISDADLAALTALGEVTGEISPPTLSISP